MFIFLIGCSKSKTVLICGDHICINNKEAEQYFEENLSLEVKILDKEKKNKVDLVQLNLKRNTDNVRKVSIYKKDSTKKKIRSLSNKEIKKIKSDIKRKEKNKKNSALKPKNDKKISKNNTRKNFNDNKLKNKDDLKKKAKIKNNQNFREVADVCNIINKCNIREISKFLIDQNKKKPFPDITVRE